MPRNTVTLANIPYMHITIRNLGIASGLRFFHGRKILMDSHPHRHETSIFNLGAPHDEVQGRQTKLQPWAN